MTWACTSCTLVNANEVAICTICGVPSGQMDSIEALKECDTQTALRKALVEDVVFKLGTHELHAIISNS